MTITHLTPAMQPVVPWKNGLGSTRQVAVDPPGAGAGDPFRWRVSLATVGQDGPFSRFPGVDRTLWLARGAGMTLQIEGQERALRHAWEAVSFPGEAAVEGRLVDGPTLDLNLMHDRARVRCHHMLLRLRAREAWASRVATAGQDLLLLLEGSLQVTSPAQGRFQLQPGEALRLDEGPAGRGWALVAGPDPVAALLASFRITP